MSTITIAPRDDANPLAFTVTTTEANGSVSRTWIDLTELLTAVDSMADHLSDAWGAGEHFTCMEAESIAAVLRAGGRLDAAESWIESHATGDDEGDMHHDGDDDEEGDDTD